MAKNTSVLIGEHFEKFISKEVSSGKYGSASEVVRTALRMLESEEEKKSALLKALARGEKSKRVENFDPKAHLAKLHKKYLCSEMVVRAGRSISQLNFQRD
ncbi:MAG: type II toxin-antitoxin system ParD family antitoxin [Sphingobacteriales bacterium]|nr:MAG: type II toxin-antitoxin system ParD family antitoxin [Sphingobacteriales bacterium]